MTTAILDLQEILADIEPGQTKTFCGVSWENYIEFTKETLDETALELTYNRGVLKVELGIVFSHESISRFLHSLITALSLVFSQNIVSAGSMSLISRRVCKGADPDESYYIQNARFASFKDELYDDETDTPPDVVVEIDKSHTSDDKFEIYAAFGIKEFWLYSDEVLRIFLLTETGEYLTAERSLALPVLSSAVLTEFINRGQREEQFRVLADFQDWLRKNK